MRRRVLALAALALLVAGAGCLGGGGPSEEDLSKNATYEWDTSVNASITLIGGEYQAVYRVVNTTTLEVYDRSTFGNEEPLRLSALQFRYPNGTVVRSSAFNVTTGDGRTRLGLPAENGSVAFTGARNGKELSVPVFVEGSYEVILPDGTGVGIPFLSQVDPGGYETSTEDGRTVITWEAVEGDTVRVSYYLDRDLLIFGGLLFVGIVGGVGGVAYYLREIRSLERRREEVGLDVEDDEDPRDRGPPPGMR